MTLKPIHQAHKSSWGIVQDKIHTLKLIETITSLESSLWDILIPSLEMVVVQSQFYFEEYYISLQLHK